MAEIFVPHNYQKECMQKIINQPFVGLFLGMGLGKTIITLTAVKTLIKRQEIKKVLIIAPFTVCLSTWTAEAERWAHTEKLSFSLVIGTEKKRLKALEAKSDIYIINREQVRWLVETMGGNFDFDMVILDELSSFKNPKAQRFKFLKKVRPKIKRVVGLTGTPTPKGLIDLWSQVYLLDQGERLGRTFTEYTTRYFTHNLYTHSYNLNRGAEEAITGKIKDICISLDSDKLLDLPPILIKDFIIKLDSKAEQLYKRLQRDYILEFKETEQTIMAVNAAVLANKLLQLCSGAIYDESKEVIEIHDAKLKGLKEVSELIGDDNALIFYNYQHEVERIKETLRGTLGKNSWETVEVYDSKNTKDIIERWNAGKIKRLLLHPASTAYGLNLQKGGHFVVWYSLPWSLELYQQANKRLHRQGQKQPVTVIRLAIDNGQDLRVIKALNNKEVTQAALLADLSALIEEVGS